MGRREDRRHADKPADARTAGQRDRDRIIYTSAYRRLAGVSQVVSAHEGHVFHNRLTHTIKVAQVARRLAEKLAHEASVARESNHGLPEVVLDPDVTEAAAHAHDLGHPPFGHVAEVELQALMQPYDAVSSFEGNAQSFRIVTKVARADLDYLGLNLSRATLDAILKYPWMHSASGQKARRKWGSYESERDDFVFARNLERSDPDPDTDARQSLEAEIMDWADDITYAVHDVEDLYRSGLVPADRLVRDSDARQEFANWVSLRWQKLGSTNDAQGIMRSLLIFPTYLGVAGPYQGDAEQRVQLRMFTSAVIGRFVKDTTLMVEGEGPDAWWRLHVPSKLRLEANVMKELVWRYCILRPALAAQQEGQKEVLRQVFRTFMDAADSTKEKDANLLPTRLGDEVRALHEQGNDSDSSRARLVSDSLCSMTEDELLRLHARLRGYQLGSVIDRIV